MVSLSHSKEGLSRGIMECVCAWIKALFKYTHTLLWFQMRQESNKYFDHIIHSLLFWLSKHLLKLNLTWCVAASVHVGITSLASLYQSWIIFVRKYRLAVWIVTVPCFNSLSSLSLFPVVTLYSTISLLMIYPHHKKLLAVSKFLWLAYNVCFHFKTSSLFILHAYGIRSSAGVIVIYVAAFQIPESVKQIRYKVLMAKTTFMKFNIVKAK